MGRRRMWKDTAVCVQWICTIPHRSVIAVIALWLWWNTALLWLDGGHAVFSQTPRSSPRWSKMNLNLQISFLPPLCSNLGRCEYAYVLRDVSPQWNQCLWVWLFQQTIFKIVETTVYLFGQLTLTVTLYHLPTYTVYRYTTTRKFGHTF